VIFHGCRRIAVVPAREGVDHPDPKYDFWVLQKRSNDYAFHNQLAVRSRRLEKQQSDHVGPQGQGYQWRDWWPLPNADGTFTIYAARRLEQGGEFDSYTWWPSDPSKMSPPTRYQWFGQKTPCVRVATPSADPLPGDPDGPTSLPYTLNGNKMIYGALEDSSDIWVRQEGTGSGLLRIPLANYRGLTVDEYCVWIFGLEGLACVTHASVQAVLSGRRGAPNWLGPSKHGRSHVPQDLSACGDGTVLLYEGQLMNGLYHIDFATDPQKGLTINWELYSDLRGASQVQKLAILGWPLIDASIQSLTEPARHRVRPSFLLN
jgi:hypothetical protein